MDLPITLGVCRNCAKLKVYSGTTIDGFIARRVYYCRAMMHETEGRTACNDFTAKEMNE